MPNYSDLISAIDTTWAPAEILHREGWCLRDGQGGGKRVSAATASTLGTLPDIVAAERHMEMPLFMIRTGEAALDEALAERGYSVIDPVTIYSFDTKALAPRDPKGINAIRCALPMRAAKEIWETGGVGPARLAIMDRVNLPKTYLLARQTDRSAGVAFVAADGGIAMLHALEISGEFRRRGIAGNLMGAAAAWALLNGCQTLSVLTAEDNAPANALFQRLGGQAAGGYHYRIKP